MGDQSCVAFLQWSLPQLELRWPGYRKVRRLVGKRLRRRLNELGLVDLSAYRSFLISAPEEWARLDAMCRIPISRFYRDRATFEVIARQLLPEIAGAVSARGDTAVKCWSAGCASGEEPYTLAMAWRFCVAQDWPGLGLSVIATDADETMIKRAEAACYTRSSLRELPQGWLDQAFIRSGDRFCVIPEFRESVEFALEDIRRSMPAGPFDLILCRNLVFTYFDETLQRQISDQLLERLRPTGFLVLGSHENLPASTGGVVRIGAKLGIYRWEA
jgi:chemotaxis protein methyltransferase CheR